MVQSFPRSCRTASLFRPRFDPLWTAAQDMDFPLHFHINIIQGRDRMAARLKVITAPARTKRGSPRHPGAFESPY